MHKIMNDKYVRILKDEAVAYFKALFHPSTREIYKIHNKPLSG